MGWKVIEGVEDRVVFLENGFSLDEEMTDSSAARGKNEVNFRFS